MARATLKSKHRASFYVSEEAWLNAIYRANKALIDAAYEGKGTSGPRAVFKSQVREYKAKGYFCGSGAIESGNKIVLQKRLKQAGMRWEPQSAQYLLTLKSKYESGRWETDVVDFVKQYFK